MPWRPLPHIAVAIAVYPFSASSPADLPLEIGDDLYIIEQGGKDGEWFRGYLVAPPSLLAGLTSIRGQTLEARVFSGTFPRCCVEVREHLGDIQANGNVNGTLVNGQSGAKQHQVNGDTPRRHRSLAIRNDVNRTSSNDSDRRRRLDTSMDDPEKSAGQRLTRVSSQSLARKLSHRSITNPQPRSPRLGHTFATETARNSHHKRPQAPVPMLKIGDETPTSASEPLVDEIASCLREWHSKNLHELLLGRHYASLEVLTALVKRLNLARRQLLHGVLTDEELVKMRENTIWDLVNGNKILNDEVIVRDPLQRGQLLTSDDSPIELTKLQSSMSLLDRPPHTQNDQIDAHHLMVELKEFPPNNLLSPSISFQLYCRSPGGATKPLTECFMVNALNHEDLPDLATSGTLRTLFTDLSSSEAGIVSQSGNGIYLVLWLQASLPVHERASRSDEPPSLSRPAVTRDRSPVKGGRQSLMWAQSKFGSVRNRSNNAMRPAESTSSADGSMGRDDSARPGSARPVTNDGSRSAAQQEIHHVRRQIGLGVINLKHIFESKAAVDQQVSIWAIPQVQAEGASSTDDTCNDLVCELISSSNKDGGYLRCKSIDHVGLGLQSFHHPNAQELIGTTPTLLQNATPTSKIFLTGAPTKPRSDIYVMISEADLSHQALLSHPERGPISLSSSLDLENVQLTLEVRNGSGARIENCIFPSSNSLGQTAWRTTAAARGDKWHHLIKLMLPVTEVQDAHLIMSIADAPGFPFALSWVPLWNDGSFILDGPHTPLLYAYDKVTSGTANGRGAYLSYPWSLDDRGSIDVNELSIGPIAKLKMETSLCSTVLSQNKTLLGILNWRQQSQSAILQHLRQFAFVPEIEIVKLMNDVFDVLFDILEFYRDNSELEDGVFSALVTVLGIVYDRRFNLGPFVDNYAESNFHHPQAAPSLIRAYLRLLADPSNPNISRRLRATFKVGRQILKFILYARETQGLHEAVVGATTQTDFKRDLKRIFDSFESLMKDPSPILIGTKTLIVQHMHNWLPELKVAFTEAEILGAAMSFIESCSDVEGKLLLFKLVLILNLMDGKLFSQVDVRKRIVQYTPSWLNPHWGFSSDVTDQWRDQIRLCSSIVAKQIDEPGFEGFNHIGKTIQSYNALLLSPVVPKDTLSLLFPTGYPFSIKPTCSTVAFDESRTELAALLASLSDTPFQMPQGSPLGEVAGMVSATLDVVKSILSGTAFPRSWVSLCVYHHKSMLRILSALFDTMTLSLLPSPEDADGFNIDIWTEYLVILLALVRSDMLALETFPEQKRRAVWKVAGDVREQGAKLLNRAWEAIGWDTSNEEQHRYGLQRLGGYQVQYVPKLVSPIIELCLSVHEGLRSVAVKILQAMIISEWTLNEDLSVVQAEIVDSLDSLFKSNNLGESMVQKMFVNELLDSFAPLARMPLDPLWQSIRDMVSTIDELLGLLASVHSPDITEELRVINTLQLMNFLRDLQKEDIFIRYVHHLAGVQARSGNKTEAGLALALHAEQYQWTFDPVKALSDPPLPRQTSFERKERLYFEMIDYFEQGAAWNNAIMAYQELANQYELFHYDFTKLARTQRSMATIYETITKGEWQPSRYFKVNYTGMGFPTTLRDKQFIYEGEPGERQAGFIDRMRRLHPSARVITKGELNDAESQILYVYPVSPYRDLDHPIHQQPRVAQPARDFITGSKPFRFAFTSKRHSPSHAVAEQWIEKTLYTSGEAFPTIVRRSEIVSSEVIRLTPLQTSVERTTRKTAELTQVLRRIDIGTEVGLENLTTTILSSVDASSATSVAQYRELLPIPVEASGSEDDEEAVEPTLTPMQNALQIALVDHVSALKHSLSYYKLPAQQHTLHKLTDSLSTTFAPELAILAPPPAAEDSMHNLLSSPSRVSLDISTSIDTPTIISSSAAEPPAAEARSKQVNRLSFNKFKGSFGSNNTKDKSVQQPHLNGSASAPSENDSSSGLNGFHAPYTNATPNMSLTANTTMHSALNSNEKAATSQSSKSSGTGKVKKRLSLLGLGRSSSSRDGSGAERSGLSADVIQE